MIGFQMNKIIKYLDKIIPNPKCELNYSKDYELLIAIVLSAQTTDRRVNKVTEILFKEYPTLNDLADASLERLEEIIREIGTYHKKALFIKEIAIKLVQDNIKILLNDREYLESLPGVGRKTVNVFLGEIYNEGVIAVDTHVSRVSKRLNLCDEEDNVLTIEKKLDDLVSSSKRASFHKQMVLFGRYHCKAVKPLCSSCELKNICKYYKENNS